MTTMLLYLGFAICCFALVVGLGSTARLIRQGPSDLRKLSRIGFGRQAYKTGRMPRRYAGATSELVEGIQITADGDKLSKVDQTRTISDENL